MKNGKKTCEGTFAFGEYPAFHFSIELAGTNQSAQKEESLFRVGDRVYDWLHGWMTINEVNSHGSIILVDDNDFQEHTFNGNNIERLSFTEYNFITGGWSQERPKPLSKVGDIGYFWNSDDDLNNNYIFYGKIEEIDSTYSKKYHILGDGNKWFKYFSTEKPF